MLALGVDYGKPGGRGRGEGGGATTEGRTIAWQSPVPGRLLPRGTGVNIKQKISKWEGLSQPEDGHGGREKTPISRSLSREALGNVVHLDDKNNGLCRKMNLSKAKSLGLDFRETQASDRQAAGGCKSEAMHRRTCSNEVITSSPVSKLSLSKTQAQLPGNKLDVKKQKSSHGETGENDTDADVTSLPQHVDDPEDSLPPGNFYTSRGFWRRLEGEEALWDRAKPPSPMSKGLIPRETALCSPQPNIPPPKPQRTFQYQGADCPPVHSVQWEKQSLGSQSKEVRSHDVIHPPRGPPPLCPVAPSNGFSRNRKNRKSFEFEDVVHVTAQQGSRGPVFRCSGLYHARSEDSIYEDIMADLSKENPYEDIKLSPMCLPIKRSRSSSVAKRQNSCTPKLPPKPPALRVNTDVLPEEAQDFRQAGTSLSQTPTTPKASAASRAAYKTQRQPQYVSRIQEIFQAKRGRKRVKSQMSTSRDELSGTESDPEESSKGYSQRHVYVQSTLRRRPGYRTLERDLIQLQQQQLFQLFVVVSLRKRSPGNTYYPEITQQFPTKFEKSSRLSRETEDRLKAIPSFCFPDAEGWRPSADVNSETFSFVLTGEDGSRWFGYCRKILPCGKGKRLPEVHCIVSRLGCFGLFAKILEEVERRREIAPALVHPFMRSVMEAPFPAPGRTITVRSFLPGSGNEELTLCRPVDSRLEHVDFDSLLQSLSVSRLLQVFASLLLERRVIFIADKLSTLSRCAHSALALLYPFTWQHTFVPVLPASMLDISCSPTPFLMGALSPSLPQLLDLPIEEVLIVDLCADKFVVQLGDEDCILPSKLQAALQEVLESRQEMLQDREEGRREEGCDLSSLVSEAFVRFFVELAGHYSLHIGETGSAGVHELNRDTFRKSHPSRGVRQFLQLFMDTQMFAGFIQDRELRKGGVRGLFEVRAAEYLASCPEPEASGVNKFLKGLGNKMKFLQKK
ncbi:DENN domain-containing protein 2C [Electrophorus electricus]|uniref:UDENN domain-containing protein n=1 Tax=Electrophorus electricus TaxID=8005 RepID=A0A4W4HBS5_ELEEL|nr:DENN domain-containing protein 2C [Electrophorus electricus]XP_026865793.2 DENN domain-containing protein 2C [Electrophorus electricus]